MTELCGNGPCAVCGRNPAAGYASSWDGATGIETWYCHGDDDDTPTCYERHGWAGPFVVEEFLSRLLPDQERP